MRALTIRQPWAWAICLGHKRVENRTWRAPVGERIAIHSGRWDGEAALVIARRHRLAVPRDFPTGAIVATAVVISIVEQSDDPWFLGPLGWVLDDVRPLGRPIPCKGALGLWRLPSGLAVAI